MMINVHWLSTLFHEIGLVSLDPRFHSHHPYLIMIGCESSKEWGHAQCMLCHVVLTQDSQFGGGGNDYQSRLLGTSGD